MGSEFYVRKRRLAVITAVLSVALLSAGLYFGLFIEIYSGPRAAADLDRVFVVHRVTGTEDDDPRSRLVELDASLRPRGSCRFLGNADALLSEVGDATVFLGNRYSVLRDGNTLRGADLGQKWVVQAALLDSPRSQAWIFGWSGGKIVARKRILGKFSEELPVASSGPADRIAASMDGASGPLVAWRERGSAKIRAVLFDGRDFNPLADFDIGAAEHWDAVLHGDRAFLVYYNRDDRTYSRVAFRLKCCEACGRPPLPARIEFEDAVLLLGRKVTGLAAAVSGDRLVVAVTRWNILQAAGVPLSTFLPEPGARLLPVGAEPLWRRIAGALFPLLMLFFSFSLIFLGFTLLRERGRFFIETLRPAVREGPPIADILQRALACILDLIFLLPAYFLAVEFLNISPESAEFDWADPRIRAMTGVWFGLNFIYHFAMEWAAGWTIGKKIIGIRVIQEGGGRLTFRGALLRNVVRVLDADVHPGAFLGASILAASRRRQRPGDMLARTLVIQDLPPEDVTG